LFYYYPRSEQINLKDYLEKFYLEDNYTEEIKLNVNFEGDLNGYVKFESRKEYAENNLINEYVVDDSSNQHSTYKIEYDKTIKEGEEMLHVKSVSGDDFFINYLGENYAIRKVLDYGVYAKSNFDNYFGYPKLKYILDEFNFDIVKEKTTLEIDITNDKETIEHLLDELLEIHAVSVDESEEFKIVIDGADKISSIEIIFKNTLITTLTSKRKVTGSMKYQLSYPNN
jgi:hypothetical protein